MKSTLLVSELLGDESDPCRADGKPVGERTFFCFRLVLFDRLHKYLFVSHPNFIHFMGNVFLLLFDMSPMYLICVLLLVLVGRW